MTTQHLDDHGQQIHPPPVSLGNPDVPNPRSQWEVVTPAGVVTFEGTEAEMRTEVDHLWGDPDGAPPLDRDPIAIHFAEHNGPQAIVPECRLCQVNTEKLMEAVRDPEKWLRERGEDQ